jgi:hypothetical protein
MASASDERKNLRATELKENEMSNTFVIAKVFPGNLNALVKNMMKETGIKDPNEVVDSFNSGKWSLVKKIIEPIEPSKPKTLAERYDAFNPELKAKLSLENGRLYFTVVSAGINADLWGKRLKGGGYELSEFARDVLSKPDYDKNHRLKAGKTYKLGLVFGTEIAKKFERTTANLQDYAFQKIGPKASEGLKGELALLISEKFNNAELEAMWLSYIAVLHRPITDSDGDSLVLYSSRSDGSYVGAYYDCPNVQWDDRGAFAFLAS